MKKFIYIIGKFLIPILLLFLVLELYLRNMESTIKRKATYHKENIGQLETLILGSSHSQNGINPKLLTSKASNLAFSSQDIKIDSALFFHYVKNMKKLKFLVFELDYHRMEIQRAPDYFRLPWYYIYHDIEVYPMKYHKKRIIYASNPNYFNLIVKKNLLSYFNKKITDKNRSTKETQAYFSKVNYDSTLIYNAATEKLKHRHKNLSPEIFNKNKRIMDTIINYCEKHNIFVILVSTPLHRAYRNQKIKDKETRRINYIDSLQRNTHILYLDYEESTLFTLRDFSNYDHLNNYGSKKYTALIDSIILKKKRDEKIY